MNTDGTGFHTCKECHKTESLWNHTTTDHKEGEQLEDRRSVGTSSCNSGDGTDQRVQALMCMKMITKHPPAVCPCDLQMLSLEKLWPSLHSELFWPTTMDQFNWLHVAVTAKDATDYKYPVNHVIWWCWLFLALQEGSQMACMYSKIITIPYLHTIFHLCYHSHPHHTPSHFVGHYHSPHHSAAHRVWVMQGQCQQARIGLTACNEPTLLSEKEFFCYKYGGTHTLNTVVHKLHGGTHTSNMAVHTLWIWQYTHFECGGTDTSNVVVHTSNVAVRTLRMWWYTLQMWRYTLQMWQYTHFEYGSTYTSNMVVHTLLISDIKMLLQALNRI